MSDNPNDAAVGRVAYAAMLAIGFGSGHGLAAFGTGLLDPLKPMHWAAWVWSVGLLFLLLVLFRATEDLLSPARRS